MRKLTLRERVLLIIFIIIALISAYLLFFYIPNRNQLHILQGEITQKNEIISQYKEMVEEQENMEEKLEQLKTGNNVRNPMPYYDNTQNVILELNEILATANKYALQFSIKENEEAVVERQVSIPFQCNNYNEIKDILQQISSGKIPCFIKSISIYKHNEEEIEAIINVSYFEYKDETSSVVIY